MNKRKKVVILGAGLSGLAAAEIISRFFEVEILEKEDYLGGLAKNIKHNNRYIPAYYHHIIKSNKTTLRYLKKFGNVKLKNLKWQRIRVAIAVKNKVHNINNIFKFIRFSYLNLYEKLRFGLFGIYTLFLMNPSKIKDGLDARVWLEKNVGKKVTKKIFHHLYSRNKFNIPLDRISAKQFAHRLKEKEVYDYFTYPKQGYQKMIDNLAKSIKFNNGKIIKNTEIKEINLDKKEIRIKNKTIKYDILLSTIPFPEFIKITKNIPSGLKNKIKKVKYCPAVSICFGTEKFLDNEHYWINLFNERIHMIMQHSILNDSYKNKINWCLRYGGSEADLKLSKQEIKKEYLGAVKKYFPDAKIKWAKVVKTKYAEPIYDINYKDYMPSYKNKKDLYFAGIQLTYPKIRNMNSALVSGVKCANIIIKENL
jgi:protoporphyrinogen oxidase